MEMAIGMVTGGLVSIFVMLLTNRDCVPVQGTEGNFFIVYKNKAYSLVERLG